MSPLDSALLLDSGISLQVLVDATAAAREACRIEAVQHHYHRVDYRTIEGITHRALYILRRHSVNPNQLSS